MEALSVVTAVYGLAVGINGWIDQRAEKKKAVKDISATISRIQTILLPLKTTLASGRIDQPIVDSVRSTGDALKRTQEHLSVWEYKRTHRVSSLLSPSTYINQLKADAQQLDHQLILLLASLAVVQYSHNHTGNLHLKIGTQAEVGTCATEASPTTALDWVRNNEVKEFWRGYVGEKIQFIHEVEFRSRLMSWLGKGFSPGSFERLMLRLDEFGVGGVSPSHLDDIAGDNSFRNALRTYMEVGPISNPLPITTSTEERSQIKLPLLVWIDDNPMNNANEVSYAKELGINVIQLSSTALVKAWIEEHSDFLRRNDDPSLIRFISDNNRDEHGSNSYLNSAAGENILRYLRGRHYNAPILIYTGWSVYQTQYVMSHDLAGSTSQAHICRRYISSLAVGGMSDLSWLSFMVV